MYLLSYCGLRTNFFTSMVLNYDFCQFFFFQYLRCFVSVKIFPQRWLSLPFTVQYFIEQLFP